MKKLLWALILVCGLLLIPSVASAAPGVEVADKTGDGTWTGNTWQVEIYPGETKATTITLHNSSGSPLGVEVSVAPDSLDGGNLAFGLDRSAFTMPGGSYTDIVLMVTASGSATPGTYTAELVIKSEVEPVTGGGGGGGIWDTVPPIMSEISHCGVTETTADICWTTIHEPSTSQVEYWSSPGMLSPLDTAMVIEHRVHLVGLSPGTMYYYRAMSRDAAGNLAVSEAYTFTTLGQVVEPEPEPEPVAPAPPKPEPTPPAIPSPTPPLEPTPEAPTPWGLIAGGIIGGLAVAGGIGYWLWRSRIK